jgi:hypothetical protein
VDEAAQLALVNVLVGYFGDDTLEKGVEGMLFVAKDNPEYHRAYITTLETGLSAAQQGDPDVINVIRRNFAPFLRDFDEAQSILQEILTEYQKRYTATKTFSISDEQT